MKRLTLLTGLTLLTVALLCGCSAVPRATLKVSFAGQTFELTDPKQLALTNLVLQVSSNGTASVSIGSLSNVNDPQVISTAAAGQVAVIRAASEAVAAGVAAGVSAAK